MYPQLRASGAAGLARLRPAVDRLFYQLVTDGSVLLCLTETRHRLASVLTVIPT